MEKVAFGEIRQDRTKVTIEDQWEVPYMLSTGAKINDIGGSLCTLSKHVCHGVIYLFLVSHSDCF